MNDQEIITQLGIKEISKEVSARTKDIQAKIELHGKWLDTDKDEDLVGLRLCESDLDLSRLFLRDIDISICSLNKVNLTRTILRGSNLKYAYMPNAVCLSTVFSGCDLSNSVLTQADCTGASFCGADLSGADLSGANLTDCDLDSADLDGVNLAHANLTGVSLFNTIGDGYYVKTIRISNVYPITYTADRIQIGCENHSIAEWRAFDNERIATMDGQQGISFWATYRDVIFTVIDASPACATISPPKEWTNQYYMQPRDEDSV